MARHDVIILEIKPGVEPVDTSEFPMEWKQGALATREAFNMLCQELSLEWSYLSLGRSLPGPADRKFRFDMDQLPKDVNGHSRIFGRGLRHGDDRRSRTSDAYRQRFPVGC